MRRCPECRGFVPEAVHTCPNCDFAPAPGSKKRWWAAPMALLGAGAFAASACSVYGVPCTTAALGDGGIDDCNQDPCNQKLADGGIKANDPAFATQCPKPDGG
jgi:hypothetical protein